MRLVLSLLGWVGTATVVGGYLALTLGKLRGDGPYQLVTSAGSILVALGAAAAAAWSVVALQLAFVVITAFGALRRADLGCRDRESGGYRCERFRWHLGRHACPKAAARHAWARAGWS